MENKKEGSNTKKKIFITIGIVLLVIILILFWWFNRKFDVNIKYNNKDKDIVTKVKYLKKVDKKYLNKDIKLESHTFIGYFETYKLDKKENKCKNGFKLSDDKTKCISKNQYDVNTKIKSKKTIEALWSTIIFMIDPTEKTINEGDTFNISVTLSGTADTSVKWSSEDSNIATVDESGKVTGVKEGKTDIIVESNGIKKTCTVIVKKVEEKKEEPKETPKEEPKDLGTIKLSANDQCIVGNNDVVTITATLSNVTDKTVNWTLPKCYTSEKVSDTVVKINRTGRGTQCRSEEERSFTVTAKLNNGNYDSLTFTFEPTLEVRVYSGSTELQQNLSSYKAVNVRVKSNVSARFTAINEFSPDTNYIASTTEDTLQLTEYADVTVKVTTNCGQTKTFNVEAEIN